MTLNYREKMPDHRTPLTNLYLANTSQIYPEDRGTNYSVRLGNQIAELVDATFARISIQLSHVRRSLTRELVVPPRCASSRLCGSGGSGTRDCWLEQVIAG